MRRQTRMHPAFAILSQFVGILINANTWYLRLAALYSFMLFSFLQTSLRRSIARRNEERRRRFIRPGIVSFNGTLPTIDTGYVGESRANDLFSCDKRHGPIRISRAQYSYMHTRETRETFNPDTTSEKKGRRDKARAKASFTRACVCAYIHRSQRTNFSHDEIKILSDTRWYKTKHRHAWWPKHARSLRYCWLSSQRPPTESLHFAHVSLAEALRSEKL